MTRILNTRNNFYGLRVAALSAATLLTMACAGAHTAYAAETATQAAPVERTVAAPEVAATPSPLVRRNKTLKGSVQVVEVDGQTVIRLSEDFRASNGPDLKVFLNTRSVGAVKGSDATDGAVLLGKLKRNRGTQDYVVPDGVNLAEFGSVLVHCEAFGVLWGGADI